MLVSLLLWVKRSLQEAEFMLRCSDGFQNSEAGPFVNDTPVIRGLPRAFSQPP